ncbi:MAG: cnrH [Ilumatobacteraceae bacterium]|nr:cnrH [Ilumatobacteraceae bacterium]
MDGMEVDSPVTRAENQRVRLFVAAHDEFVRAVVARRIDASEVDDVVQAVFIAAWRKFSNLESLPVPSAQRVWLYRAAYHELLTRYRANGRRARLVARVQRQPDLPTTAAPETDEVLERSMAKLSTNQRRVIHAIYWDGLTTAELGLLLRCSPTAARKQISRALDQLRHWYAQEGQA